MKFKHLLTFSSPHARPITARVGVNVRLLIAKSYRNFWMQLPNSDSRKVTIRQALLINSGAFRAYRWILSCEWGS